MTVGRLEPAGGPSRRPPSLGRAAAGISGLTLASRSTGFVRVLVATAVLGTTYLGNTYQAANAVPNVVFELFAAGALHAVLVPTLVSVHDDVGREEAERLAGGVLGALLVALGVIVAIGMVAAPLLARFVSAGVDDPALRDAQVDLGTVLLLVFLPQIVLYGIGLVATGALHAEHRFTAPAAAPMANNVVVLAAYTLFWWLRRDAGPWPSDGLDGLEIAVLAGGTTLGVVALIVVPVVALARTGFRLRPQWRPTDERVRRLGRHGGWAFGQVAATQGLLVVVLVLGNAVAGGLVAFQFGYAFFLLPVALVAVPVVTAIYPRLSREPSPAGFGAVLGRSIVTVSALSVLAAAALAGLAWPIVRVTAFGQAADAGLGPLARAVGLLAPGVVGYGLVLVLTRAAYARSDTRRPALVMLAVLAVAGCAMAILAPDDVEGRVAVLAGFHSAGYVVAAVVLWVVLQRSGVALPPSTGGVVGRVVVSGLVAAGVMGFVAAWAGPAGRWAALAIVAVGGAIGLAVYAGVLRLVGLRPRELVRLEPAHG